MEDTYEWKDNSRKMFDEVVLMTPWLFRSLSRNSFLKGFQEKQLKIITEEDFIEVCKAKVPEKFVEKALAKCEELRTKK
jgi:hypothetical protein